MEETPSVWDMGTERLLNFSEHKEVSVEEMQKEIVSLKELYASVALSAHDQRERIGCLEDRVERVSGGNELVHAPLLGGMRKEQSWYEFIRNNKIVVGGLALVSSVAVAVPLVAAIVMKKSDQPKE